MKDFTLDIPKRDIKSISAIWKSLPQEKREYYTNIAKTITNCFEFE